METSQRIALVLALLLAFDAAQFAPAQQPPGPRTMEDLLDAPTRPFHRPSGIENTDLDKAVAEYNAAIEEAIKDVATPVKKQLEQARRQGNLEVSKRYEEAQRAIEKGLLMPRLHDLSKGARNNFEKAIKRATAQTSSAYEKAIKDYTRGGDTKTAEAVKEEYYEFLAHPSRRALHVPSEAVGFRGHWYLLPSDSLALEPAIAAAFKHEGYLLVINDAEENEFIQPLVQEKLRMGLLRVGGTWMILERKPATFFCWDHGQPENLSKETSACIHANGKWHDYPAGTSTPYCIEWE
jgi:tetratricopeptide (TPR) repeat protein